MSFRGIYPILYAFFGADGRLDEAAMRRQVQCCLAGGAHGLAVLGLATEVNKLSAAEKRDVVRWSAEEIADCHVLFISRSEGERLEAILARLKGRAILTVGDATGFARRGVMIRLVNAGGRIRMRINLEAAQAGRLVLSSKLLRPAEIVETGKD